MEFMHAAISAVDLSKRYTIGQHRGCEYETLRESIMRAATAPWRQLRRLVGGGAPAPDAPAASELWGLRGGFLPGEPGGGVGGIRRNGAGETAPLEGLPRNNGPPARRGWRPG